jgi:hypothetical protein
VALRLCLLGGLTGASPSCWVLGLGWLENDRDGNFRCLTMDGATLTSLLTLELARVYGAILFLTIFLYINGTSLETPVFDSTSAKAAV